MDWIQFTIMVITFVGLFTWNRSEGRADWRHMDNKFDSLIRAIQEEMKDFHGRLCKIEENRKNK